MKSERDWVLIFSSLFLIIFSLIILRSVAPFLFPLYLIYIALAVGIFLFFSALDYEILSAFSRFFYIGSIIFLIIPLLIGQVTRGAVRWIPVGSLTIQPAEIVRPFILVFFAYFFTSKDLTVRRLLLGVLLFIPFALLILAQPSLGVTILVSIGVFGTLLASNISKKKLFFSIVAIALLTPLFWQLLAPYQKLRVLTFLRPQSDPLGAGYNALQSMIAVGSGEFVGRGLGKGVQTQLSFLPERHTDFIFAATSEELGFMGAILLVLGEAVLLFRIVSIMKEDIGFEKRALVTGIFLTLFTQTFVHMGMNMGLLPITGIPLPLVSSGGSDLLGVAMMLGIIAGFRTKRRLA